MIEPISPAARDAGSWQARVAAMQQQLAQKLFQTADANGDGALSKSEFESFYSKFTATTGSSNAASQTVGADQLFQHLDAQGTGQINAAQFGAGLKLLMTQPAKGFQPGATGSVGAQVSGVSQSQSSQALGQLFSAAPVQSTAISSAPPQNAGSLEFIA